MSTRLKYITIIQKNVGLSQIGKQFTGYLDNANYCSGLNSHKISNIPPLYRNTRNSFVFNMTLSILAWINKEWMENSILFFIIFCDR